MNNKNMGQLLEHYRQNLNMMNDSNHDEIYKWDAVRYFQDNWDVDEDNFGTMFENAVSQGYSLTTMNGQPVEGIIESAKYDEETVRNMFREFFAEDGGDLKIREEKLQDFIDQSEELRRQFAKDQWRYAQDYMSATAYLAMYSPDDNYLYHPEAVQRLSEYIEIGKDVGNGKNFSLIKYYHFCDQIRECIEEDKEILSLHHHFLRDSSYPDHSRHILTYDFIRSLFTYQLYGDIVISKRAAREMKKEKDEQELKVERLEKDWAGCKEKYAQVVKEIEQMFQYEIQGMKVTHKKYGDGIITEQKEKRISVDFSGTSKAFLLPEAFSNGFLRVMGQSEVTAHYTALAGKIKEEKELKNQIQLIEYELGLQR